MKLFSVSLSLFFVCLFSGCISEDTDSCPVELQNNLILKFLYTNDQGTDIFTQNIDKVDVFVFDSEARLVHKQAVDQASLSAFTGTSLNLPAGIYRIVCWGNALNNTSFGEVETADLFKNAFLSNSGVDPNNGDRLYYAPFPSQVFTVTVSHDEVQTAEIAFCSAHIKIQVYVRGFDDKSPGGDQLPPLVKLVDIPSGYNFDMQASNDLVSYQNVADYRTVEGQNLAVLDFNTPLFGEDTPSQLMIKKQSDGTTVTTISLKDFIKENNISLDDNQQVVIPILIEYKSVGVNITLPGWGQNPVKPGLN